MASSWSSTSCRSPAASPELIRDLLEFRRIFGREIARLAAARSPKVSADGLVKLRELADRADKAPGALELFEIDFDFYVAVAQLSGSQVMLLLINTVRDGVRGFMPLLANLAAPGEIVRKHHRDLIAAVEHGDVAAAGRVADEYLRMGAELAGRMGGKPELQPQPLPPLPDRPGRGGRMGKLTRKEVEEIALLARLHLGPPSSTRCRTSWAPSSRTSARSPSSTPTTSRP